MGTVLRSLNRWQDGLLLLESFESPNFMLDQAWTLLNGTPARSNLVAFEGLYSFELDDTYPWIEKDFSPLGQTFTSSTLYFFDDAAVVAGGYTPFVEWEAADGSRYGMGVDLAVSTVNYTGMAGGVKADSGIPRVSGWRRFTFIYEVLGNTVYGQIDNQDAFFAVVTSSPFSLMRLGAQAASGTEAFGFFDLVQVCLHPSLNVYGPAYMIAEIYDEDGVLINTTQAAAEGLCRLSVMGEDSPFNASLVLKDSATRAPFFHSPVQSFSQGDVYLYNSYDFGRKPSAFSKMDEAQRNDLKSVMGVKQSVFFNDSDRVTITFEDLTEDQKNDLDRWWTSAKRGQTFAVAIDGNNTYFGKVTADNFDPTSAAVEVDDADALAAGAVLVIRDNDGDTKQTVKVSAVDTGTDTLTLTQVPAEPILAGQQVRSQYYWPFCTTTENSLRTMLSNLKLKRWTVSISFEEAIQP